MKKSKTKYVIGIDEAGRGPLAGPVAVGVVCLAQDFDWKLIEGVNDSKKLSEKKREEIYNKAEKLKKDGMLYYAVAMIDAKVIDKVGITASVGQGVDMGLENIHNEIGSEIDFYRAKVLLDGLLHATEDFTNQTTIIKGDQKEKVIGLASILAKVTRDRHMVSLSKKKEFSVYGFDIHKGYGTKKHRESIVKHGLSKLHRRTYCKNIQP